MADGPWTIRFKGYLPIDDGMEERLKRVSAEMDRIPDSAISMDEDAHVITIDYAQVKDRDDALHTVLRAVRAGDHIVVKPPWDEYPAQPGDLVLDIDPGIVFGSGLHESTRLCLQALEKHLKPGCFAADFGTGSGVLAIAAAKLGAARVIAFDADPDSVEAALANVQRNGFAGIIQVRQAESPAFIAAKTDLVTANLTAEILTAQADAIFDLLASDGKAIVSGMTDANYAQVEDCLSAAGFTIIEKLTEGRWVAMVAARQ